jgi:hypothetical protein
MTVDLSPVARDIRSLLSDAVEIYLQSRSRSPAEHPQVTRVELAFLVGPPPSLYVDLDTRPDAEPDGDATHRCVAQSQHANWKTFLAPQDKTVRFTLPDGSAREFDRDDVDREFASFLVSELNNAHEAGTFDRVADRGELMLTVTYEGCPV